MFGKLRQAVFWKDDFQTEWRITVEGLKLGDAYPQWNRRFEEKKAYWLLRGKRDGLSPKQAVYEGLLEIADGVYRETREQRNMEETYVQFAKALYYALVQIVPEGKWIPAEERIPERWRPYYEISRQKKDRT